MEFFGPGDHIWCARFLIREGFLCRTEKVVGRPKRVFRRDEVVRLRDGEGLSWCAIGKKLGIPAMTARFPYGFRPYPVVIAIGPKLTDRHDGASCELTSVEAAGSHARKWHQRQRHAFRT